MHHPLLNSYYLGSLEQRTVENCWFVLTSFPTDIKLELVPQPNKVRIELPDGLAEMHGLESHWAYLDDLCIHPTVNHLLKELWLITHPKVSQWHQAKPGAHILDSEPLVVREYSPACDSLYLRMCLLYLGKELVEIFDLISLFWVLFCVLIIHLLLHTAPLDLSFDYGDF